MTDFLDFLKLPPTILSALSMVSGCILFLPKIVLEKMGLEALPSPYNMFVGIVFLLSSALLLVYLVKAIYKKIELVYYNKKFPEIFAKKMQALLDEEKVVVLYMYNTPSKTANLPINDGITRRLEAGCVIQKTGTTFLVDINMEIPYMLTPIAIKYIKENPEFQKEAEVLAEEYKGLMLY